MSHKLGDLLINDGIVTSDQLQKALAMQLQQGGTLGESLVKINAIASVDDLAFCFAKQLNTRVVNLEELDIDPDVSALVPEEMAVKHRVVPIKKEGRLIHVVISDPRNVSAVDAIRFLTDCTVRLWMTTESQMQKALDRYYRMRIDQGEMRDILEDVEGLNVEVVEERDDDDAGDVMAQMVEAPLVRLVNKLIVDAVRLRASDIHVESYEKMVRVRYRLDGVLVEQTPIPFKLKNAIVSRLKIMSNLDIAERRLPQDGRIKMAVGSKVIDLRVNTLPTVFGEKVVLRILDPENLKLDLTVVGFLPAAKKHFQTALQSPHGMILVTGPTGSGKTTTLYSALHSLNAPGVNIMTAEDPVEYNLQGINQVHVKSEIGLSFASALRAFLRQDPDIILVGEIRDLETAQIGVKAALTGHLVLSTLHTNDAPSTVSRLTDMGVEPFLVASSVRLITAQRLVRKLCPNCKDLKGNLSLEQGLVIGVEKNELDQYKVYQPAGCKDCSGTGYKGRIAIHQVLPIEGEIKDMILDRATPDEIEKASVSMGHFNLRMSAMEVFKQGLTTPEEVIKTTKS